MDLPNELIIQVQRHTGYPWWNGEAYAWFKGYPQKITLAIEELESLIEELRGKEDYEISDRLRLPLAHLKHLQANWSLKGRV